MGWKVCLECNRAYEQGDTIEYKGMTLCIGCAIDMMLSYIYDIDLEMKALAHNIDMLLKVLERNNKNE